MFTRRQKRKRRGERESRNRDRRFGSITESAIEVPAQRAFFWQGAMKQLGQLAERIKMALRRSQALEEGLAERDRIPW